MALDPTRLPMDGMDVEGEEEREEAWVASRLVPCSARMVVERLACERGRYVRVLVNDQVQPLEFCVHGNANREGEGICKLDAFVASQAYARSGGDGDWEECFA